VSHAPSTALLRLTPPPVITHACLQFGAASPSHFAAMLDSYRELIQVHQPYRIYVYAGV